MSTFPYPEWCLFGQGDALFNALVSVSEHGEPVFQFGVGQGAAFAAALIDGLVASEVRAAARRSEMEYSPVRS